jgi:hypothetical protein
MMNSKDAVGFENAGATDRSSFWMKMTVEGGMRSCSSQEFVLWKNLMSSFYIGLELGGSMAESPVM